MFMLQQWYIPQKHSVPFVGANCLSGLLIPRPLQVQWRGFVLGHSPAAITFTVVTDGFVRLFVNRVVVLNASGSALDDTALVAKPVVISPGTLGEIVLEYERKAADAFIKLEVMMVVVVVVVVAFWWLRVHDHLSPPRYTCFACSGRRQGCGAAWFHPLLYSPQLQLNVRLHPLLHSSSSSSHLTPLPQHHRSTSKSSPPPHPPPPPPPPRCPPSSPPALLHPFRSPLVMLSVIS
jgi:hypothetical protein